MDRPDDPAVHRTEPQDAADEGYPIADDGEHARRVAAIARDAIAAGVPERDDSEIYVLAERFLSERPDGTTGSFIDWLKATGAKA